MSTVRLAIVLPSLVALLAACDRPRPIDAPAGVGNLQASACTGCHGDPKRTEADPLVNAAPPVSPSGSATAPGVGAHLAHLHGGTLRGPIACKECHVVPTTTLHANGKVEVLFADADFALRNGATPRFDPATASCATTYCHGATLNAGGTNQAPTLERRRLAGRLRHLPRRASAEPRRHQHHLLDLPPTHGQAGRHHRRGRRLPHQRHARGGRRPPGRLGRSRPSTATPPTPRGWPAARAATAPTSTAAPPASPAPAATAPAGSPTAPSATAPAPRLDQRPARPGRAAGRHAGPDRHHRPGGRRPRAPPRRRRDRPGAGLRATATPSRPTSPTSTGRPPSPSARRRSASGASPAWNGVGVLRPPTATARRSPPAAPTSRRSGPAAAPRRPAAPATGSRRRPAITAITPSRSCGDCHPGYTRTSVNLATHVDGSKQVGNLVTAWNPTTRACTGCHGADTW